jgi:hypothetical protein
MAKIRNKIAFFVVECYHLEDRSWILDAEMELFLACNSIVPLQMMDEMEFFWIDSSIFSLSAMPSLDSLGHSCSRNFIKVEVWRQAGGDHG